MLLGQMLKKFQDVGTAKAARLEASTCNSGEFAGMFARCGCLKLPACLAIGNMNFEDDEVGCRGCTCRQFTLRGYLPYSTLELSKLCSRQKPSTAFRKAFWQSRRQLDLLLVAAAEQKEA